MWGDSWVNVLLKMKDMPYYHFKSKDESKKGDADILKSKFSKYIQK